MEIKEKFELLRNVPNILSLSDSDIKSVSIEDGPRRVFATLELLKARISHFTRDKIFKLVSDVDKRERLHVVVLKDYLLPVGYNKLDKSIIVNLNYFHTSDLSRVNPRDVYALMVYGLTFHSLILNGSRILKDEYYQVIAGFIHSVLVRVFAKEYGLLGVYAKLLPRLKFLLSCYILDSFFGIKGDKAYRLASSISVYNYNDIVEDLSKFDFSNIEDFIKSLAFFNVMRGMDRYRFTGKIVKFLGINFLAALEDPSRFMAVIAASNISGSSVIPSFIFRYNQYSFDKLLTIIKGIF